MIRVVICEDSKPDREMLSRMIRTAADIEVVGIAGSGEEVVDMVPDIEPDVLTMDIHLPGRSGISVIDELMAVNPLPILVISDQAGRSEVAMEALASGAVDVSPKPELNALEDFEAAARELTALIRIVARAKVIRHLRGRLQSDERPSPIAVSQTMAEPIGPARSSVPPETSQTKTPTIEADVLAIAASTGGPQALREFLAGLPAEFSKPTLVVQHIAKGFTEGFAQWLSASIHLGVKLADDGEVIEGGIVYVAPEGRHMIVRNGRVGLEGTEPVGGHCPSADVMFESLASAYGKAVLAVILTGMGRDGAMGMRAIHDSGGTTWVQDEASCAVFGMPKAALDSGAVDAVIPLGAMAATVLSKMRGVSPVG